MSTDQLDHNAIKKANQALAAEILNVRKEVEKTEEERTALATEYMENADNAAIHARLIEQVFSDEVAPLNHRLEQGRSILGQQQPPPVVDTPPAAQPPPVVVPPANQTQVLPVQPNPANAAFARVNPRNWSWISWILAILGFFVGLLVASFTWTTIAHAHHGFSRGLIGVLWYIGCCGFGFFAGGFGGSFIPNGPTATPPAAP